MVVRRKWNTLYWLMIIYINCRGCRASNQYCRFGLTMPIKMDDKYNRDEMIVPTPLDYIDDGLQTFKSCRWTVESSLTNHQVVLLGVPVKIANVDRPSLSKDDLKTPADLIVSFSGEKFRVQPGTFYVASIERMFPLTVEASWESRTQTPSRVQLRILVVLPGLCDASMLDFKGSCYARSDSRVNLTTAMARLGGDARLASFSSSIELRNFTDANKERVFRHPYRQPLIFNESVRLGMFYYQGAEALYSVTNTESVSCSLQPIATARDLRLPVESSTGRCAVMKVDTSNRVTFELDTCNSEKFSFIMFPETPNNRSKELAFKDCNIPKIVDEFLQRKDAPPVSPATVTDGPLNRTETVHDKQENESSKNVAVIVRVVIPLVVALGIVILIIVLLKRRQLPCRTGTDENGETSRPPGRAPAGQIQQPENIQLVGIRPIQSFAQRESPSHRVEQGNSAVSNAPDSHPLISPSLYFEQPPSTLGPPTMFADTPSEDVLTPEEFERMFRASNLSNIPEASLENQPESFAPEEEFQTCAMNVPRNLPAAAAIRKQDQKDSSIADPSQEQGSQLMPTFSSLGNDDFQTCQLMQAEELGEEHFEQDDSKIGFLPK